MKIQKADDKSIKSAISILNGGGMVIYPTETCYGIGVDATNTDAVTKLLAYKGDRHRQVSVAVTNISMAKKYVKINEPAKNIYNQFLPGPLTVISKSLGKVDNRLESSESTLGIRIPNHSFALKLISEFGKPITATSANTSGKKEPYSLKDWETYTTDSKKEMVDLFLDGGKLEERPTSTVVDTTLNEPEILRQGEINLPSTSPSFTSHSSNETQNIAHKITSKYLNLLHKYPLIYALQGDLGAGKTQFAKGLAKTLRLTFNITSPTYTLMKEYPFNLPKYSGTFYHIDTWRLSDIKELESTLNFSKLLKNGNIICLEWAGKAKSYLDKYKHDFPIIYVDIKDLNDSERTITYFISIPEWS